MIQGTLIDQLSLRLSTLSTHLKSCGHDATVLEGVCMRLFEPLFGWTLRNLNQEQGNFPGVDLGDERNRIAIQITVQKKPGKAAHTLKKIKTAKLRDRFDLFLCFFLLEDAPGSAKKDPADFRRLGIGDLIRGILKPLRVPEWLEPRVPSTHHVITSERLEAALKVLEETLAHIPPEAPRPVNLPFRLNKHFGQRDAEMQALETALAHSGGIAAITQPQVVHGLGGVGKTQLAVEYAWRHAQDFTALLWLPADSPSSLTTGLSRLCDTLELPQRDLREDAPRAEATLDWLARNQGWLLIADNADTPEAQTALMETLRPLHTGRVLITSRLEDWGQQLATIPLRTWTPAQGAAWLTTRLEGLPIACPLADATALAQELGGLPLALEQAAAYMAEKRLGPAEYLRRYRANEDAAQRLLATPMKYGGGTGYEATVARTWLVTLDQLTPLARAVMKLIAWLGPDEIPRFLFTRAPQHVLDAAAECPSPEKSLPQMHGSPQVISEGLPEPQKKSAGLPESAGNPLPSSASATPEEQTEAIEDALALLARYALIELHEDYLTCHRLVQTTQRWDEPKPWLMRVICWVNASSPNDPPPQDVRSWPLTWIPLQKPLEALLGHEASDAHHLSDAEAAETGFPRLLNVFGLFYQTKADFSTAEPLHRRALHIDEASYGPDHPEVATALNNLATLLQVTNRLAGAEPLYRRALRITEASYGPDHPSVATRLNNLAALLQDTNRLAEAEEPQRRALRIDETSFGPDHPKVAIDLNNLAQLLQATNRLAEAEEPMRRALRIDEASFGPDHPNVAIDLNNLARLLQATNRLAEAEPLYRRALRIDEASYGPDHPNVAIGLNNLAQLLQATNRLAEAVPLQRRAVEICTRSLGAEHPRTRMARENLEGLLAASQRSQG
ncbi:MAG: tetratricopeptide repeat protein [Verrucomicrobiaceae bacterium]|nr:tetratricopeptide repeat protein [Verrucomicrobiaceae bacterium]